MDAPVRFGRLARLLLATTAACLSVASTAAAGTLEGTLTDSITGTPIPDGTVRVLGTDRVTTTDDNGHWQFELPEGTYELEVEVRLGDDHHRFRVVHQRVPQYKEADTHLPTTHFLDEGVPAQPSPPGAPVPRLDDPAVPDGGEVDLDDLRRTPPTTGPRESTIPDSPPMTIRVGIREDHSTCRNSPIVAIEKMPLDEYVKGVLAPEIGVFRNQDNAIEVYRAFAPAAKSYGLWFMLRYGAGNRRTVSSPKPPHDYDWFHIDNTPCNQRYSDMRFETSNQGADAMAGQFLVKDGAPDTLDKFEYAASCGGHGTRPEYQNSIVPDDSPAQSCVGDWCGHDDCAGHADHPSVDDSCSCCLVRGICQWGSLEWADSGKDASWILDHYEPNLMLRQLGDTDPETVELTGFVHSNPADVSGSGIPDATVELSDGQQTTSGENGRYTFDAVPLSEGTVTITASKSGYETTSSDKDLVAGKTNWESIHLPEATGRPDVPEPGPRADAATDARDLAPDGGADTGQDPMSYGGLGPMVAPSPGIDGGCSCSTPRKKPSGRYPLSAGLVALGLVVWHIRRRDTSGCRRTDQLSVKPHREVVTQFWPHNRSGNVRRFDSTSSPPNVSPSIHISMVTVIVVPLAVSSYEPVPARRGATSRCRSRSASTSL